jgi:hypothetical protein
MSDLANFKYSWTFISPDQILAKFYSGMLFVIEGTSVLQ